MNWFDLQTDFYRPLWIRVTVTAVCVLWALFEFINGSPVWGMIFLGLGIYCAYQFFWVFKPEHKGSNKL